MKKILIVLLIILMALSSFAACQKTPESPIVVGNHTEKMIEQAQKENDDIITESQEPIDLYARLNAPETYSQELVSKGGRLHVFADAQVLLPSCELPIVRVKPTEFTLEQARRFAKVLMGGDATYVQYDYDNLTQGAYERKIERLRYGLSDWESIGSVLFDLQYDTREEAEAALAELTAKAASAPAAYPSYTPDFEWEHRQSWVDGKEVANTNTYLALFATEDQKVYSHFEIRNTRDVFGTAEMTYIRDDAIPMDLFSSHPYKGEEQLTVTAEEAQQLAEKTVVQMGIEGFACAANCLYRYRTDYNGYKPAHHLIFKRQICGVTETCTNHTAAYSQYNQPWHYETIHILIDDEGILRFEYISPYEVIETVVTESELLPFSKIIEIFEKMAVIVGNEIDYNTTWEDSGGIEYHITSVRLGLVSVREQNGDTGLLVPAWDFLGYERGRRSAEYEWSTVGGNELASFLTINAVDGNIIERGY